MVNGGFAYGDLFISQNNNTLSVFKELLNLVKPNRILEIGTFHGGLTLMLRDIMDSIGLQENVIKTYDINSQDFLKPLAINRNIQILTKNLFNSDYSNFYSKQSKNEIQNFIQKDGVTLVLCDGGCKKCEFNLITPILKKSDIIMAHDYAPNINYFNKYIKGKIWDWLEIEDSDIKDSILNYNLQPYYHNMTQKAAWCCYIKNSN